MRDRHQPYGLYKRCRRCTNQERADQRARKPQTKAEASAEWNAKRPRVKELLNADPLTGRAQRLLAGMRSRSRECDLPLDPQITREVVLSMLREQSSCPCCGTSFDLTFYMDGKQRAAAPSIDRMIPARGYVLGNISLLCWRCNHVKGDATPAELRQVAAWMDRSV